jgi:8-oxo-dGTP diphosphatase
MESHLLENYGNRLRIRVCGLCWKNDQLLVIDHKMGKNDTFWAPPGGGVEFGEHAEAALIREFAEEVSLTIEPIRFQFACELVKPPLHALELFFEVNPIYGKVKAGFDPESPEHLQLIKSARYMEFSSLMALNEDERHGIFRIVKNATEMKKLNGFYRI